MVPDIDVTLPPRAASVRHARRLVGDLTAWCPADVRTTVALLTSELASNAVIHARTPFTMSASIDASVIRVAISDSGGGRPELRPGGPTPAGGWGLTMVDGASSRWGVDNDGRCTSVWFELDVLSGH